MVNPPSEAQKQFEEHVTRLRGLMTELSDERFAFLDPRLNVQQQRLDGLRDSLRLVEKYIKEQHVLPDFQCL